MYIQTVQDISTYYYIHKFISKLLARLAVDQAFLPQKLGMLGMLGMLGTDARYSYQTAQRLPCYSLRRWVCLLKHSVVIAISAACSDR